ncbi:MAG: hypothetical protein LH631_05270 [Alkalinema sp. CAN_BIN05]|nr:hypothetical protein [Alkalinema sp. CAN_BIN05]
MNMMKPLVKSCINMTIGGALVFNAAIVTSAQEVPKLKQKMSYHDARKILLDSGWQAILLSPNRDWQQMGAGMTRFRDLGYDEVVDCSGTGLGFCRFEFASADSRKLVVVTAGGTQRPLLYRWSIEVKTSTD